MGIHPDIKTLEARLASPIYSKLIEPKDYFAGSGCLEFYEFIRDRVVKISDKKIAEELSDYLLPEELIGLPSLFKAAFVKLK